jgi:hypothetical protein
LTLRNNNKRQKKEKKGRSRKTKQKPKSPASVKPCVQTSILQNKNKTNNQKASQSPP